MSRKKEIYKYSKSRMVTSFPKRLALLGRKIEATNAAPMDADHVFERDSLDL
jgi:hypothetical protein